MNPDPNSLPGTGTVTVNGQAWIPKIPGGGDPIAAVRSLQQKSVRIQAVRISGDTTDQMIFALSNVVPGKYTLSLDSGSIAQFLRNNVTYSIDFTHTGTLSLDKVDEDNHRMTITFSFTAVSDAGDSIQVTNGKLDNFRFVDQ